MKGLARPYLNATTVTVGSFIPILRLNSNKFEYIDQNNTPRFLWKTVWRYNIFVIQQKYPIENQKLVDVVVSVLRYDNNTRFLLNINACCLSWSYMVKLYDHI